MLELGSDKSKHREEEGLYVLRPWDRREGGAFMKRIKASVAQALRVSRKVLKMSVERKVGPDLSFVEDFGH